MDRQTIIFTADKRQEKLAALLEGEVVSYAWEEEEKDVCEKVYILPIPVTKLNQSPIIKEKLKQELAKKSTDGTSRITVFGGVFDKEWKAFLKEYAIPCWDFMKLPEVIDGNAKITAEATVAEVLQLSEKSIEGQKMLVTGYGCCGEKIARIFSRLGAEVIVAARRAEVREKVEEEGYSAVDFSNMEKSFAEIDTVINTVPSMVVTENCIRRMKKNSLIVDIASKPGGTDFRAAEKYGITAKLALGLPGIYTTTSSAQLLKNAISKYTPPQNDVREDKLWIFQIVI